MRSRSWPATVRPVACFQWLWVAALLFACQLGPVYTMRSRMKVLTADFTEDIFVQLVFVVLYSVALVIAARRYPERPASRSVLVALAVFCGWLLCSSLWSVDVVRTVSQAILLVGTTLAGLTAGWVLTRRQLLWAIFVSQQLGAAIAYRAVTAKWVGAIDEYLQWTGIYFNRNSLGPVAMLGLLMSAFVVIDTVLHLRQRRALAVAACLAAAVMAIVDVRLARGAGSITPVVGVAASIAAIAVVASIARIGRRIPAFTDRPWTVAAAVVGAFALAAALLRSRVADLFGKGSDLNGRSTIWDLVTDQIRARPVRGWGWVAAWSDLTFRDQLAARLGSPVGSAHSGYLEVVLGTGVIGGLVFAVLLGLILRDVLRGTAGSFPLGFLPLGLLAYALVVNLGETYVGADLLPWVLLMAAVASAHGDRVPMALPAADRARPVQYAG